MSRILFGIIVLSCVSAGCNQQLKWTYPLNYDVLYRTAAKSQPATVAVLPFKEMRPGQNQAATMNLYVVPGFPFGWSRLERPEAAVGAGPVKDIGFRAGEDLAKAAVASLEASGLFKSVYFADGGDTRKAHFILSGAVRRTTYRAKIWSYGLSIFAYFAWVTGVPAFTFDYETEIEMTMRDQQGVEYWAYTARGEEGGVTGAYYSVNPGLVPMMIATEQAMNEAIEDLSEKLPRIVASYRESYKQRRAASR